MGEVPLISPELSGKDDSGREWEDGTLEEEPDTVEDEEEFSFRRIQPVQRHTRQTASRNGRIFLSIIVPFFITADADVKTAEDTVCRL